MILIGVIPRTLEHKDAELALDGCKMLMKIFGLTGVKIAFRESRFTRSALAGPKLLGYLPSEHPTADVCSPLTPALGLKISARATPNIN